MQLCLKNRSPIATPGWFVVRHIICVGEDTINVYNIDMTGDQTNDHFYVT